MELDLWPAFVSRGDVQALAPGQRMFLIELGTISANIEDLEIPEGFVPEGALAYMRWDSETMTSYLAEFEARRWITSLDEPRGWRIEGWLDRVQPFIPGSTASLTLQWGQQKREKRLARREADRLRKKRFRERNAESNESP
jgi:hypothetical protein